MNLFLAVTVSRNAPKDCLAVGAAKAQVGVAVLVVVIDSQDSSHAHSAANVRGSSI